MYKSEITQSVPAQPGKTRPLPKQGRVDVLQAKLKSLQAQLVDQRVLEKHVVAVSELERQRIGRDLHDSLGGHLTGVALLAKALTQMLARSGRVEADTAVEVVDGLREAIVRTREIAHRLCPVGSGQTSLANSLRKLAAEVSRRTGSDCQFQADEMATIVDGEVAAHLLRIAEEAVQNALRHGNAKRIDIRLRNSRSGISLRVWNDGERLPAKAKAAQRLGLHSMRYRATVIGASLDIRPARRGGTEVCCRLAGWTRKGRKSA